MYWHLLCRGGQDMRKLKKYLLLTAVLFVSMMIFHTVSAADETSSIEPALIEEVKTFEAVSLVSSGNHVEIHSSVVTCTKQIHHNYSRENADREETVKRDAAEDREETVKRDAAEDREETVKRDVAKDSEDMEENDDPSDICAHFTAEEYLFFDEQPIYGDYTDVFTFVEMDEDEEDDSVSWSEEDFFCEESVPSEDSGFDKSFAGNDGGIDESVPEDNNGIASPDPSGDSEADDLTDFTGIAEIRRARAE